MMERSSKEEETQYISPKGEYVIFQSEEEYLEKGREWGLFNKTAKDEFWYKGKSYKRKVKIKGYEVHGTHNTLVIEFQDGNLSCIHPSYLKEMQSLSFGKETNLEEQEENQDGKKEKQVKRSEEKAQAPKTSMPKEKTESPKSKKEKIALPSEKVRLQAKVKEFSTKYNAFTEEEDEVVLYEETTILGENPIELKEAWSGYSKTLKKLELEVGDVLEFDAKVVEKKFNKEIRFKINNPSKIEKK